MFNGNSKKRILFVGMPDMAYVCLDGLKTAGFNIVGVIGAKKTNPTYSMFKNFVLQRKLNFLEYNNLNDEDFIQNVRDLNADIAVVCSFNYKIPKILLESVKDGFINVHPSLLPKYRGPNPYSVAILNKEKETGLTLHFMDETFDTGDIIVQKTLTISSIETMGTLFNRLNIIAVEMLINTLNVYEAEGSLTRTKQPEGVFEVAPIFPEKALYLNYSKSARENEFLIRALNPFILARTIFRHNLLKILSAEILEESTVYNQVGEIIKIDNDKFYISTTQGLLAPTSVQFGSYFAGTSKDFINILDPQIGEKFL